MARTLILRCLRIPEIVALSLQAIQILILILLQYIIVVAIKRRLSKFSKRCLNPFTFLSLAISCRMLYLMLQLVDSSLKLTHSRVPINYFYVSSCSDTLQAISEILIYWSILLISENRLGLLSLSPIRYRTCKSWHRMLMVVLVLISLAYIIYDFLGEAAYITSGKDESDDHLNHALAVATLVDGIYLGYTGIYMVEALYVCGLAVYMTNKDVLTKSLRSILLTATVFLFIHEAYYFAEAILYNLPAEKYGAHSAAIILPQVFDLSLLASIAFLVSLVLPITQGLEEWELGTKHFIGPYYIETTTISNNAYRQEQTQQRQPVEKQQQQQQQPQPLLLALPPAPNQTRPTSPFYNQYQPNEPSPLKVVSTIPYSPHHSGEYSLNSASNRNSRSSGILYHHQQQLQLHITTPSTHTRHSSAYQESRTSMASSRPWSWQSEGQFTVRPVPVNNTTITTTTTTTYPVPITAPTTSSTPLYGPTVPGFNTTTMTMARYEEYDGNGNNDHSDGRDNSDYIEHQERRQSIVTAVPRPTWHYQVQEMTRPAQESTTIER